MSETVLYSVWPTDHGRGRATYMLIPVLYACLDARDKFFEHSQLISQWGRASSKSVISKESLIDGILSVGASEVPRFRISQGRLKLEILIAEAVDLAL